MKDANEWNDDCFFCETCNKPFRTPLFDVTRDFERTIYFEEPRYPEVEIVGANAIANFCSASCRNRKLPKLLENATVRATYPGIGPIETCSRCGGAVQMSEFHLAYVVMETKQDWDQGMFGVEVADAEVVAVVCQRCEPVRPGLLAVSEPDEDEPATRNTINDAT